MAIEPEQAVELTHSEREHASAIESLIDRTLREEFPGDDKYQMEFAFGAIPNPSIWVKQELKRRYEGAGWSRFSLARLT